ncbi:hypothetical protein CSOJ01_07036 [Colletotrichum sojae]|uniref:Uncharacterized protein n=1 Tax=Colletotrichum sojae TaxID=2175907 RepID=A0A8H6MUY0_9PEZI|nr:hypothetical protein CSOJ01_07036 [Colletotrichum sojae]
MKAAAYDGPRRPSDGFHNRAAVPWTDVPMLPSGPRGKSSLGGPDRRQTNGDVSHLPSHDAQEKDLTVMW